MVPSSILACAHFTLRAKKNSQATLTTVFARKKCRIQTVMTDSLPARQPAPACRDGKCHAMTIHFADCFDRIGRSQVLSCYFICQLLREHARTCNSTRGQFK
jgi:hypothetical protein